MTIIGGQSLCLLLTLLVTPVAYSVVAEREEKRIPRAKRIGGERGEADPKASAPV